MWFLLRLILFPLRWAFKVLAPVSLLLVAGVVAYLFFWLPDVSILGKENPETTAFIELTRDRYQREGGNHRVRRTWVDLDQISPALVEAVLIAEDDRFFLHQGFDFTEIMNAMETNLEENRFARGGSTLSQQLAKNLYLSPEKSYTRKFNEALLTWKLEHSLSKERILELYLNVAEWGDGIFGVEEAARYYFKKDAKSLNEREAVSLAARLPNPHGTGDRPVQRRKTRERIILERLQKTRPGYRGVKRTLLAAHQPDRQKDRGSWLEGESVDKLGELAKKQFDSWWESYVGERGSLWNDIPKPASRTQPERIPITGEPSPPQVTMEPERRQTTAAPQQAVAQSDSAPRPLTPTERQARIIDRIERLEKPEPTSASTAIPTLAPTPTSTPLLSPKKPNAEDVYERLARLEKLLSEKN
ncbi:MAG: monofunctional biosynthetic peptidoglycan transglycosylase [Candidatus Omnitrophica bacterium]|nr:monofunctional biosynthetic peptidoglycan transglycosylase [Candidatus Omnitrophota bacterium]